MKYLILSLLLLLTTSFSTDHHRITIYTIGDSTMANKPTENDAQERGWGMMLPQFFTTAVRIENHAKNGRSTKSFRSEGLWHKVISRIRPGDYLFIQFGHNDQKPDTLLHTDPGTTYRSNLARYIREARAKGATPVLFTSIVRRSFRSDGTLKDTHGQYLTTVRSLASELHVLCIDMNAATARIVQTMGDEPSKKLYMWIPPGTNAAAPEGKKDDTHLNIAGATLFARIVADSIRLKIPALAPYIVQPQP